MHVSFTPPIHYFYPLYQIGTISIHFADEETEGKHLAQVSGRAQIRTLAV